MSGNPPAQCPAAARRTVLPSRFAQVALLLAVVGRAVAATDPSTEPEAEVRPKLVTGDDVRKADDYLSGGLAANIARSFKVVSDLVIDWTRITAIWKTPVLYTPALRPLLGANVLTTSLERSLQGADLPRRAYLPKDVAKQGESVATLVALYVSMRNSGFLFPYFNFVQGFRPLGGLRGAWHKFLELLFGAEPKWRPPVQDETMGILTYQDYAKKNFNRSFPMDFFEAYYTGGRVPSWEDNDRHRRGIRMIDLGMAASRSVGVEPMNFIRDMKTRVEFNSATLTKITWHGFSYMGPYDIKYASNGVYGISIVDKLLKKFNTNDALGVLMTDSVFSVHLKYKESDKSFHLDLTSLEKYTAIPGYAALGGGARFTFSNGRLRTEEVRFGGKTYTPSDSEQDEANRAYKENRLLGWRYAEKAVMASLLGMTNLVTHVKDLHLELAAAFQAVSVDAFASKPTHPLRRLLDPFIHRSVQATNDNFKLLYEYRASEFSLAPLTQEEQLRLIDDSIKSNPMVLADLDMERFGALHDMDPAFSEKAAQSDSSVWFWRWHYRSLTVQRLFDKMISCWLDKNYGEEELDNDELAQSWWQSMIKHIPSVQRTTVSHPDWAAAESLTRTSLRNVLKTLFVWLAWVHEDVGHAASAYVYNPLHTPMCVPLDGEGVPLFSFVFNVAAYRGFVFLERAKLLDSPPSFWFGDGGDEQCFSEFQHALRELGDNDIAFSECDENGFYSCVSRVETAVSS